VAENFFQNFGDEFWCQVIYFSSMDSVKMTGYQDEEKKGSVRANMQILD
jgi:hypothetical protein